LVLGLIPILGGLLMLAVFLYGLKTQAHIVSWVTVIILVVVFGLGFIIHAVRPESEYFTSIKERRESGIKGSDEL